MIISGNRSGNCGYSVPFNGSYTYFTDCTGYYHPVCGLLHCEIPIDTVLNGTKNYLEPNKIDLGGAGRICTSILLNPDTGRQSTDWNRTYLFDVCSSPLGFSLQTICSWPRLACCRCLWFAIILNSLRDP